MLYKKDLIKAKSKQESQIEEFDLLSIIEKSKKEIFKSVAMQNKMYSKQAEIMTKNSQNKIAYDHRKLTIDPELFYMNMYSKIKEIDLHNQGKSLINNPPSFEAITSEMLSIICDSAISANEIRPLLIFDFFIEITGEGYINMLSYNLYNQIIEKTPGYYNVLNKKNLVLEKEIKFKLDNPIINVKGDYIEEIEPLYEYITSLIIPYVTNLALLTLSETKASTSFKERIKLAGLEYLYYRENDMPRIML